MVTTIIIISLLFPFLFKYTFVITNQYTQLPIILSNMNPGFLANDWYVRTSAEFGPRTIFALYSAFWGKIFGLPLTYFLHYTLSCGLIFYATYRLSLFIYRDSKAALLSAVTVLFGASYTIGGNLLLTRDFTVTQLALGLSLFALNLLIEGKLTAAAILAGVSSYLHPLLGPLPAIIGFVTLLIRQYFTVEKNSFKKIIRTVRTGLLPFIIMILPLVYLYLPTGKPDISARVKTAIIAVIRTPHHFLPQSFPLRDYLLFSAITVCAFLIIKHSKNIFYAKIRFFTFSFTVISVMLMAFSALSINIWNFYPGVILQPFRLTLFIYWFTAVIIYSFLYSRVLKGKLPSAILFIPLYLSDYSRIIPSGKSDLAAMFLGLVLLSVFRKLPFKFKLAGIIIFFSLFNFHDRFNYSRLYQHPTAETETAQWAEENSPPDAVFLVPPEFEKFRLVAGRAIVADWKAFPFQEEAYFEWFNRMCDLSGKTECSLNLTQEETVNGYSKLDYGRLKYLAEKYDADYIISINEYPFEEKFKIDKYFIYTFKPNKLFFSRTDQPRQ